MVSATFRQGITTETRGWRVRGWLRQYSADSWVSVCAVRRLGIFGSMKRNISVLGFSDSDFFSHARQHDPGQPEVQLAHGLGHAEAQLRGDDAQGESVGE